MKKLYIAFILLIAGSAFGAAESFKIELYGDSQKTGGLRLSVPLIDLRTAIQPDKYNFGIQISTAKFIKKLPVEVKFGNLSASGSLSRLNSPELSSSTSPFSNGIISTTGLTASLPGYTVFSKSASTFLQIKTNQLTTHPFTMYLNLWFSPENPDPVFSAMIYDKFFDNRLIISSSFTTGRFMYEANDSSSWFLDNPYYMADAHSCSLIQFSAEIKNKTRKNSIYTGFMTAIYESPFGPLTAAYRLDLKLSIKHTDFYASAFLNQYEDILTSSAKLLSPSVQLKCGFLTKKPVPAKNQKLYFIKTGANIYSRINLTKPEHPLRLNAGFQLTSDITTLSLSVSGNAKLLAASAELPPEDISFTSISMQFKNSWYLKTFTPGITLSAEKRFDDSSDSDSGKMKYKAQLNLTNNSRHKISGNCAFSFSSKDKEITDKKFSAGLTCRMNIKAVTIIGKLTISSLYLE